MSFLKSTNQNLNNTEEIMEEFIYFARDSFCMGDDVIAPNARRYNVRNWDWCSETDMYICLQDYLGPNLPGFHWRGYCGQKRFVDIYCKRDGETKYSFDVTLVDDWKKMLMKENAVYFKHCSHQKNTLPECLDEARMEDYTAEELAAILDRDDERYNVLFHKRCEEILKKRN